MEIQTSEKGWVFADMEPFIVELLRGLPACADPDDEASRARIFSTPTGGADPEADIEWREENEPEMRELFQTHVDIAAADIAVIRQEGDAFTLAIPSENSRAWIHTLNQARLALGVRHAVTEGDTAGRRRHRGAKAFAIMQIDFYGMLLSVLLAHTEL
jgi:hypothetical protein